MEQGGGDSVPEGRSPACFPSPRPPLPTHPIQTCPARLAFSELAEELIVWIGCVAAGGGTEKRQAGNPPPPPSPT